MPREYKKKEWVIKCGGAEAYLTEIIPEQLGHTPIYRYGTKDKNKALRVTEEEARELAEKRHAEMVKVNYKEKE